MQRSDTYTTGQIPHLGDLVVYTSSAVPQRMYIVTSVSDDGIAILQPATRAVMGTYHPKNFSLLARTNAQDRVDEQIL